jgi:hypothetical protein
VGLAGRVVPSGRLIVSVAFDEVNPSNLKRPSTRGALQLINT